MSKSKFNGIDPEVNNKINNYQILLLLLIYYYLLLLRVLLNNLVQIQFDYFYYLRHP